WAAESGCSPRAPRRGSRCSNRRATRRASSPCTTPGSATERARALGRLRRHVVGHYSLRSPSPYGDTLLGDVAVRGDGHRGVVLVVPRARLHPAGLEVLEVIDHLQLAGGREARALVARQLLRFLGGVARGQRGLLEQRRDDVELLVHRVVRGQAIRRRGRARPGDAGRAELAAVTPEALLAGAGQVVAIA